MQWLRYPYLLSPVSLVKFNNITQVYVAYCKSFQSYLTQLEGIHCRSFDYILHNKNNGKKKRRRSYFIFLENKSKIQTILMINYKWWIYI